MRKIHTHKPTKSDEKSFFGFTFSARFTFEIFFLYVLNKYYRMLFVWTFCKLKMNTDLFYNVQYCTSEFSVKFKFGM